MSDELIADKHAFVADLKELLVRHTNRCTIQHTGWPCGTCICALLTEVMDYTAPEYSEHNEPVDRVNEVWRAILQIRELDTHAISPLEKKHANQ